MTTFPASTTPRPAIRPQAVLARDWLKTLWPASYKGVPFKVELDEEIGRRRIVEHEMPMRDDPFLEDLGEGVRHYKVDAYVASDSADGDAASVIAVCAMRGPGALVLPAHGPLIVRCLDFKRNRAKDRHGYIALELRFTREGAASSLSSIASLANLVFVQADSAALAVANAFVSAVQVTDRADFVVQAATDRLQDGTSALEALRSSQPVDPDVSAAQRTAIQSLFDQTPDLVGDPTTIATVPQGIIAIARALGDGMAATTAAAAFEAVLTDPTFAVISNSYPTANRRLAEANANAAYQLLRLACIIAYTEAVTRITFTDRQAAITVRANAVEYFGQETDNLSADDIDLVHTIEQLRDSLVTYLSRAIINLAPVVTIEASASMPSLWWAWRLYADPTRSTELVARNRLPDPSIFPLTFEALAT